MERQVSVGPDRTDDHLWRWTTLTGKFPRESKHSIYFSTEIYQADDFGIMKAPMVQN